MNVLLPVARGQRKGNLRLGLEEIEVAITGEGWAGGTRHDSAVKRNLGYSSGHAGGESTNTGIATKSCHTNHRITLSKAHG